MTRPFRKNVGLIGLGIIGRRIAEHLRRQGLSVFVWNRTPRPVPNFVGSPAELTQTCNYLQIFVSDDDALMRMIQLISPDLTASHIVIAHPTVSPDTMREAASLVERRGARLVEAPFTGSKLAAEKGQLVYYVSGEESAVAAVRPLLQASSTAIVCLTKRVKDGATRIFPRLHGVFCPLSKIPARRTSSRTYFRNQLRHRSRQCLMKNRNLWNGNWPKFPRLTRWKHRPRL